MDNKLVLKHRVISDKKIKIDNVIHLADIHIRDSKERVNEYITVFEKLIASLSTYDKKKTIITIVGDILEDKSMKETSIFVLGKFFEMLDSLDIPVLLIYGNHDAYKNTTKNGALRAIFESIAKYKNIYSITETGTYTYNNIMFVASSVFQNNVIVDYDTIEPLKKDKTTIYLFHGTIGGSLACNDIKMKSTITLNMFKGYDYVLLGDIHKHQFLDKNRTRAYSGSLIQQNFGESLDKHGYILYNLKTKENKLIEIENMYGFVKLYVTNGVLEDNMQKMPKYVNIKLYVKNTERNVLNEISNILKKKYNVLNISSVKLDTQDNKLNKELINIDSVTLFDDIAHGYIKNMSDFNDAEKKILLDKYTTLTKNNVVENKKGLIWKILKLKFSNILSYGCGNVIDFANFSGIIGFTGQNGIGKSAIIDCILFSLYEKSSRTGHYHKELIINNNIGIDKEKKFECELTLEMDETIYVITRTGSSTIGSKIPYKSTVSLISYKKNSNIITNHTEGKSDTVKIIEELFGSFNDNISTIFMLQNNTFNFSQMKPKEKKQLLENICGLEKYKNNYKSLNEKSTKSKYNIDDLEKYLKKNIINPSILADLNDRHEKIKKQIHMNNQILDIFYINREINTLVKLILNKTIKKQKETINIITQTINNLVQEVKTISLTHETLLPFYEKIMNKTKIIDEDFVFDDINLNIEEHKIKSAEAINEQNIISSEIKVEQQNVKFINDKKEEMKTLEKDKKIVDRLQQMVEYEIPKIILNKIISKIETHVNEFVSCVSTDTIRFEMDETQKDNEVYVYVEHLNENDKSLEQCSGSEKFIVDLAIRIAFSLFTKSNTLNSLFIDEGFASFDADKLDCSRQLFELLKKHFSYIIIISHLDRIKSLSDNNYTVTKNKNGRSIIQVIDNLSEEYVSKLENLEEPEHIIQPSDGVLKKKQLKKKATNF